MVFSKGETRGEELPDAIVKVGSYWYTFQLPIKSSVTMMGAIKNALKGQFNSVNLAAALSRLGISLVEPMMDNSQETMLTLRLLWSSDKNGLRTSFLSSNWELRKEAIRDALKLLIENIKASGGSDDLEKFLTDAINELEDIKRM